MTLQRAKKSQSKLRIGLCGPSGSGKSYSALMLAKGIAGAGGRIAAIDTERGSLSLYSNLVDFDVVELKPPYDPRTYIDWIKYIESQGYNVIIIDSITHEWSGEGGILELVEKMPGQNSFQKWGQATPLHQKFIDSMLKSDCHIIATMRSKTEYVETEKNGKKNFQKAGSGPQQREGIDYEFTLILDIERDKHIAMANKDRTQLWDTRYEVITEQHGVELMNWLNSGVVPSIGRVTDPPVLDQPVLNQPELIPPVHEDNLEVRRDIEPPKPTEILPPSTAVDTSLTDGGKGAAMEPDYNAIGVEIQKLCRQVFPNSIKYQEWIQSHFSMAANQVPVTMLPTVLSEMQSYAQVLGVAK
jgi:hypothetical protein